MLSREKLLHPATAIALVALFVSLGGVTYAAATIGTNQIKNSAVTNVKLRDGAVSGSKLRNGAVGRTKIARGAVRGDRIAREGVSSRELARGAVNGAVLADSAVSNAKLGLAAVTGAKLADGAVAGSKLADRGVAGAKLADGAVGAGQLADRAVATAKLADGAVTAAKLAPGAVVAGRGQLLGARQQLRDGTTDLLVLDLPAVGALRARCAGGDVTLTVRTVAGTVREVQVATQEGGGSGVLRTTNGELSGAFGDAASSTWQVASDGGVATLWVASAPSGGTCIVTAQALVS